MKYHVHINPDAWTMVTANDPGEERQVVISDFGDGYRLVVELRRTQPPAGPPLVQQARLELYARIGTPTPQWHLVRRVRVRDLVLIEEAASSSVMSPS